MSNNIWEQHLWTPYTHTTPKDIVNVFAGGYPSKATPITWEEVEKFCKRLDEEAKHSPRQEPVIWVHPKDLEAAKKFFGQ